MSEFLSKNATIFRTNDVVYSDLDDELIILLPEVGKVCSLNQTARQVWMLLGEVVTFDSVCARLREKYDVGEEECQGDATQLIFQLERLGLLTIAQEAA